MTTALFAYAAAYCLARIVSSTGVAHRIDHGAHLLMALAMIAMAWPWGDSIPLAPQAVVFGISAIWFALRAIRGWRPAGTGSVVDRHRHGPATGLYHSVMMSAMVWMAAVMAGWLSGAGSDPADTGASTGHDMANMDMAHMDMADHAAATTGTSSSLVTAVSLALTVIFAVAALAWLFRAFRSVPITAYRSCRSPLTGRCRYHSKRPRLERTGHPLYGKRVRPARTRRDGHRRSRRPYHRRPSTTRVRSRWRREWRS